MDEYCDYNGDGEMEDFYRADDYEREQEGDGKQFYVNPNGMCEDAPCCGCCGYM